MSVLLLLAAGRCAWEKNMICELCRGEGWIWRTAMRGHPEPKWPIPYDLTRPRYEKERATCPHCLGRGFIILKEVKLAWA